MMPALPRCATAAHEARTKTQRSKRVPAQDQALRQLSFANLWASDGCPQRPHRHMT